VRVVREVSVYQEIYVLFASTLFQWKDPCSESGKSWMLCVCVYVCEYLGDKNVKVLGQYGFFLLCEKKLIVLFGMDLIGEK